MNEGEEEAEKFAIKSNVVGFLLISIILRDNNKSKDEIKDEISLFDARISSSKTIRYLLLAIPEIRSANVL